MKSSTQVNKPLVKVKSPMICTLKLPVVQVGIVDNSPSLQVISEDPVILNPSLQVTW